MTAPEGARPEETAEEPALALQRQMEEAGQRAKAAALKLAALNTQTKNDGLLLMAEALVDDADMILDANAEDLRAAEAGDMSEALIDRITLTPSRLAAMHPGPQAAQRPRGAADARPPRCRRYPLRRTAHGRR